jgi:putative DNA primase/helicase
VTIKLGNKNTADPLKIDGKSCKWLIKTNDYNPLPKWLYPMEKKKKSNPRSPITEIDEGNRNQELFTYILKLQIVSNRP